MHIPGVRFIRDTLSDARDELVARRLFRKSPDDFVLHGVALHLGGWATESVRDAIYRGAYEQPEREVLLASLRHDDVVVELGCGTGYMTTIAARVASEVRSFDANPAMVEVAIETLGRNAADADIRVGALARSPARATTQFYVRDEFAISSLQPSAAAHAIEVPTCSFMSECSGATYLLVDIEGAEVTLLGGELPGIRAVCVECHPKVVAAESITRMLTCMFGQGFVLDLTLSRGQVLFLSREFKS